LPARQRIERGYAQSEIGGVSLDLEVEVPGAKPDAPVRL
jgi:hypothetical protein